MTTDRTAADPTADPHLLDLTEVPTAVVHSRVAEGELRDFFDKSFRTLPEVIAVQEAMIQGPAFGLYREAADGLVDVEVGFPVDRRIQPDRDVTPSRLPAGKVARIVHVGAFDGLSGTWDRLRSWIGTHGLTPGPVRWEVYLIRPNPQMDPSDLRTELNWPVLRA
ncbi:GyrI-like domain-containing protein [Nocardia amamiensis]|uniref:GyrI-like domain-containing protein n=1 Tax=Nocardia amamiensis TaxID=404578 RepID=A0ABS0CWY9_9NOCA|nr:GyrI-like domain-containing protein [Nocardia amamiensis]MBF6301101.1 GyrI-like domain-containing protein [Nocardia amamiensis]